MSLAIPAVARSGDTPARSYFPGMGQAVADRTINRKITKRFAGALSVAFTLPRDDHRSLEDQLAAFAKAEGWVWEGVYHVASGDDATVSGTIAVVGRITVEEWADVAERVALGNALMQPDASVASASVNLPSGVQIELGHRQAAEFAMLRHHLRQASLLMSGRHLQHGDETQPTRPMEVFTNCATSALRSLTYRLLLNGAGVGTAYDDDLQVADLNNLPVIIPIIEQSHADVKAGRIGGYLTRRDAEHLYAGRTVVYHQVADSREGWAKAVEIAERMAFNGERDTVLLLDFSVVRPYGAAIKGMQNRPASGPAPMMMAMLNVARLRDAGMEPWRASMYADHYLAECVLVGGARRAARMATKWYLDPSIFGFIQLKRGGFLWSSNNSVAADEDFRARVSKVRDMLQASGPALFFNAIEPAAVATDGTPILDAGVSLWFSHRIAEGRLDAVDLHCWKVIVALAAAAYKDGTGEPGLIFVDRLTQRDDGLDVYDDGDFVTFGGADGLDEESRPLAAAIARVVKRKRYKHITNPCGEISILLLGAYCVICDVVPFHAANDDDAESAFRAGTRALIRTNLMRSLYQKEVKRTNRIGVGMTGVHEWIWSRFGLGFRDIVEMGEGFMFDANGQTMPRPSAKAMPMWLMMARFARAVSDEARRYSAELGVVAPHTDRTIKPAGTTSKLFGLTEGAHLPPMLEFMRWVQFRNDDPLVAAYAKKGYPIKRLTQYAGTTIVGFPTSPAICQLGMGDKLMTAPEATMEQQMRYLRLLETFWIRGVNEDLSLLPESGNQVSYTAKYDPRTTDYGEFFTSIVDGQFKVRCCSVMPQTDASAYEYQPEEPVTKATYELIRAAIIDDGTIAEDIGLEHVGCAGACPVDFNAGQSGSAVRVIASRGEADFIVYSQPGCSFCEKATALLDDLGVSYTVVELIGNDAKRGFFDERGFAPDDRTTPKVYALKGGVEELIGGFTELKARCKGE